MRTSQGDHRERLPGAARHAGNDADIHAGHGRADQRGLLRAAARRLEDVLRGGERALWRANRAPVVAGAAGIARRPPGKMRRDTGPGRAERFSRAFAFPPRAFPFRLYPGVALAGWQGTWE